MIYSLGITSPANTSQSAPTRIVLPVTKGLVYQISVWFPPGPCGLMGVRICDHSRQLYPSNAGSWFVFDSFGIDFPESHEVGIEPYELLIEAYNEDALYEHTARVCIGLVSEDVFIARFVPELAAQQLLIVLEALTKTTQNENLEHLLQEAEIGTQSIGVALENGEE